MSSVGVGLDADRCGDRPETGDGLHSGGQLPGQDAQPAVVVLGQRGLLRDGHGEAPGFAVHVGCGVAGPSDTGGPQTASRTGRAERGRA